MVGLVTAKGLALAAGKPLVAVNHLEGHALSPMLSDPDLAFPYLLLLVSGGHCQLLLVEGVGRYRRLATTIDDAAGEAFDKTAKLLGLGFPGGPGGRARGGGGRSARGAAAAAAGRLGRAAFLLRRPEERGAARAGERPLCRRRTSPPRFQQAVVDCLVDRTPARARERADGATALVVAGGVAANQAVRAALDRARRRPRPALRRAAACGCAPTMRR